MKILAIDPATRCGWAMIPPLMWGVQDFSPRKGESPGMRFLRFRRWLSQVVIDSDVKLVAYERGGHFRSVSAAKVSNGMEAILLDTCAERGVEVAAVQNSTLKKHATGRGNAKKPEMVEAGARRWGVDASGLDDNEADALCILAWATEQVEPHPKRRLTIRLRGK